MTYSLTPIGRIAGTDRLHIDEPFRPALAGLDGFSHLLALWWFDRTSESDRNRLIEQHPYPGGPDSLGVFATRSPRRPNPIAASVVQVLRVDAEAGEVHLPWIDADDGSPLLDLKPYQPSLDRVAQPATPVWCAGWPASLEDSADFDWSTVFGPTAN